MPRNRGSQAPDDGITDATAEDQIDPSHQLRLVPHVIASFGIFSSLHESRDELTMDRLSMIDGIEGFLFRVGRWSETYRMRIFHFRKAEKMLRKEHSDTLRSMKNLAEVLSSQGKYEEAEEMHEQALALTETVLRKEQPYADDHLLSCLFAAPKETIQECESVLSSSIRRIQKDTRREAPDYCSMLAVLFFDA